jgi:pimeloyl-ACP methyl ester carboxylesterase
VVEELAAGTSLAELTEGMVALLVPPSPVDPALARDLVEESYSARARADLTAVPGVLDQMGASLAAAVDRFGGAGLAADLAVQFQPGFDGILGEVRCPVVLVHGRHDGVAGPAVGEWLARRLPDATVEVWDHGHQGLLVAWERWLTLTFAG